MRGGRRRGLSTFTVPLKKERKKIPTTTRTIPAARNPRPKRTSQKEEKRMKTRLSRGLGRTIPRGKRRWVKEKGRSPFHPPSIAERMRMEKKRNLLKSKVKGQKWGSLKPLPR
jgi:hypothetical protein